MRIILSSKRVSKSQIFGNSSNSHRSCNLSGQGTSLGYLKSHSKENCSSNTSLCPTKVENVTEGYYITTESLKNESQICNCFPNGHSSSLSKSNVKKGLYFFGNEVRFISKNQDRHLVHLETCPVGNKMRSGNSIYHEKQVKSLCALHALNNLFQDGKAFSQTDLDTICRDLSPHSWVNPHKSVLGFGNYDINVIMTALQTKQYETIWFDKRKDPSELNFENIYGYILNVPSDCRLGWLSFPIKRKHWVAIRRLPQPRDSSLHSYYNLDSKMEFPDVIGNEDNLINYLRDELRSPEKELFLVVTMNVGRFEAWKKGKSVETGGSGSTNGDNPEGVFNSSDPPLVCDIKDIRKTSNDSGVVELLSDFKEFKDISVVDLDKEEFFRRQSSGVWSDFN